MQKHEVNDISNLDGNYKVEGGNERKYNSIGNGPNELPVGGSPLYGPDFQPNLVSKNTAAKNVSMLHEQEILDAIDYAQDIYTGELKRLGYSPLTINSYQSAIDRFTQFLSVGQVIPDYNNKPDTGMNQKGSTQHQTSGGSNIKLEDTVYHNQL